MSMTFFFLFLVLGIEPRATCLLGQCPPLKSELYANLTPPQCFVVVVIKMGAGLDLAMNVTSCLLSPVSSLSVFF